MLSVTPAATVHHHSICPATSPSSPPSPHHSELNEGPPPGWGCIIAKSCRDELNDLKKFGDEGNIDFIRSKRLTAFYKKKTDTKNDENVSIDTSEGKLTSPSTRKNSPSGEKRKREVNKCRTVKSVKFARLPGILKKESVVSQPVEDDKIDEDSRKEDEEDFTDYEYLRDYSEKVIEKESLDFSNENPLTEETSIAAAERFLAENEEMHFPPMDWNENDLNEYDLNPVTNDIFIQPLYQSDMPHCLIGFPNPPGENRCWLNATLHALFALPLIDKLSNIIDMNGCSKLTKTLVALEIFWKNGQAVKDKTYQTVMRFKEDLSVLDSSYPSERQQDVSEFLMIFLNHIQTDCEKMLSKNPSSKNDKIENQENESINKTPTKSPSKRPPLTDISPFKRQINFSENLEKPADNDENENNNNNLKLTSNNPIDEVFLLHMIEHYVCRGCSNHRQRKIDNLMLYVDLPENQTDSVDLACSISKSMDTEERTLTCTKCKSPNQNVYTSFGKSPNILIVQVKRYAMTSDGYVAKINTPVKIPEVLILDMDDNDDSKYVPICMIAHVGAAMDCGHYTSYVKHDEQWYHYNDLDVTPMTSAEALSAAETTAYVVFYMNINYLNKSSSLSTKSSQSDSDEPSR